MSKLNKNLAREACYINGQWVTSEKTIAVHNPANGELLGHVPNLGIKETKQAIDAAAKALPAWAALTPLERGKILNAWATLIEEHADELAQILTLEQGKPVLEARSEVLAGANNIRWNAEESRRAYGQTIPTSIHGRRPLTIRQPIGVVAAITPWNFPSSMITRKAPPALAAGCPVVIKPASLTPFSATSLAVLAEKAGIPAGVLNVITGGSREIGSELTSNPTVKALSFTGSTAVGKQLMQECSSTLKRVSLELGGNAPFIIFNDADIKEAAKGAFTSKFRNAGQTCICANRIFVQKDVYDAFLEEFTALTKSKTIGNGMDKGTEIGPMITNEAAGNMQPLVDDALAKGAKVVLGGKQHALGNAFYEPTILSHVSSDMRIFKEEIFGPIAPVISFTTEEEVISLANSTSYGLASYFYTRDIGRIWRVSEALEFGMVGINDPTLSTPEIPFGGIKESGMGREGGTLGIDEFSEIKYILMGGINR